MSFSHQFGSMRRRRMEWQPANEQQRKLFESGKEDLICFMTIYKEGVNANKLYGKIVESTGREINFRKMGFNSFGEFLYECRDLLRLKSDGINRYYLFLRGSAPADVEHLRRLVTQESGKTKYKGFVAKHHNTFDVSIDMLLKLHYDLKVETEAPPCRSKSLPRERSSSRRSNLGGGLNHINSSVPYLKPLNAAAVQLQATQVNESPLYRSKSLPRQRNSSRRSNLGGGLNHVNSSVPYLKPLNAAAVKLQANQVNESRPVPSASRSSILRPVQHSQAPTTTVLRHSRSNDNLPKPVNKVPTLLPLTEIYKKRAQENVAPVEPKTATNPVSTQQQLSRSDVFGRLINRHLANGTNNSYVPRQNLPAPPLMDIVRRQVGPGMLQAIEEHLISDDGYDDLEYFSDCGDSSDDEYPTTTMKAVPLRHSVEDESIDEIDGSGSRVELEVQINGLSTALSSVKIDPESVTCNVQNGLETIHECDGDEEQDRPLLKLKFQNIKSARGGKTIFHVDRQMRLPEKPFQATFLGADSYGFIYIQVDSSELKDSFQRLQDEINKFYNDTQQQDEFRMRFDEMKVGNYIVGQVKDSFCRGRIDEIVKDKEYCIIFDIDNCVYNFVKWDDIYHIYSKFAKRLPRAVMCIQRGTEQFVLTSRFEKLFSDALPHLEDSVRVTEIGRVHPLFQVPIISITCNEHTLSELLFKNASVTDSSSVQIISLSLEQQVTMKGLVDRCYITPTK